MSVTGDAARPGRLAHVHEHPEISDADLGLIRKLAPEARLVLDIGAGRGGFVRAARARGLQAWALDLEPDAAHLWRRDGVPGALGDGARAPFADGSLDVVRLKELIEHVEDPLALIREAARLLRPGGLLIVHTPSPYSQLYPVGNFWDDYTHVRPFSRLGLRRLIEDGGLRLERIEGYVAGRNALERALGRLLAPVLPHTYRVLARR